MKKLIFLCTAIYAMGCGRSLFEVATTKDSREAKLLDTKIAINEGDYARALSLSKSLWSEEKNEDHARYYSLAILGNAGLDLFDLIIEVFSSLSEGNNGGGDILDSLTSVEAVTSLSATKEAALLSAINILEDSALPLSSGLSFQKCITAGLYAAPTLATVASITTRFTQTIAALESAVSSQSDCDNQDSGAAEALADFSALVEDVSALPNLTSGVFDILNDECEIGSGTDNSLTGNISTLVATLDRGCTLGDGGFVIGDYPAPECVQDAIDDINSARAGDGRVNVCEFFQNCSGGSCLTLE